MRVFACLAMVSAISGWACPKQQTAIPDAKSRYFFPFISNRYRPSPLMNAMSNLA